MGLLWKYIVCKDYVLMMLIYSFYQIVLKTIEYCIHFSAICI